MSNTTKTYWDLPTEDRKTIRNAITDVCGDFGDSSRDGLRVAVRKGTEKETVAAAEAVGMRLELAEWGVFRGGKTLRVLVFVLA